MDSEYITLTRLIFSIIFILFAFNSHGMSSRAYWEIAIDRAIHKYCLHAEPTLESHFKKASVTYPPKDVALLAFKKEKHVQLWARNDGTSWRHVHTYPLTAYSGHLGPKLKEGDKQIPEGIYELTSFNPFSSMHLSILINYPNQFDKNHAIKDKRKKLGNDIFIHGKNLSVGCLAIGDKAIEEIFLLVRRVGLEHTSVIIAPNDFRKAMPATPAKNQPRWLPELYQQIAVALQPFSDKKHVAMNTNK